MSLDVLLCRGAGLLHGMFVMSAREVRMVGGLLVIPLLVVFRGLPVVSGGLSVVIRGQLVVLGNSLRHPSLPTET